jgi:hypothetical protein
MNQKDLLKRAINFDNKEARLLFITNWLEDINWHSENKLFGERNIDEFTEHFLDGVQWLLMALNPGNYCDSFIANHEKELAPYRKAILNSKTHNRGTITLPCGRSIGESTMFDLKRAQNGFSFFSHLTGYGLCEGWNNTTGIEFVKELEEILHSFDAEDEERANVHAAYARAYAD